MLNTLREYNDNDISAAIRGANVYGAGDEKLGSVEDAIVNSDSGDLRYLIIDAGWLKSRRFIIPVDQVYGYGDSDDLFSPLSKPEIERLPEFRDECLASEDAFARYDLEYRGAWQPQAQASGLQPSNRLARLRQRIQDAVARRRAVASERTTPDYPPARYSGSVNRRPTGVYGVYSDRKDVENTVSALKDSGFDSADISVVFPNPDMTKEFAVEKNTKSPEGALAGGGTGLVVGGTLGWLAGIGTLAIPGIGPLLAAGPIVAAIAGAGVGSAIGGIAGALIGLGLPELEAKRYEEAIKKGRILVSVYCQDMRQAERARKILDDSGAKEVFLSGERKAA